MKRKALDEATLALIESSVGESVQEAEWLAELVRVYRLAKQRDESEDVGLFEFFFDETEPPGIPGAQRCNRLIGMRSVSCKLAAGHEGGCAP